MDIQSDSTMVKSPGNQPGRKVEVSKDIPSNPLEKMLGADAYSEFPQSITISFETYPKRMDALSNALGNKDTVKG